MYRIKFVWLYWPRRSTIRYRSERNDREDIKLWVLKKWLHSPRYITNVFNQRTIEARRRAYSSSSCTFERAFRIDHPDHKRRSAVSLRPRTITFQFVARDEAAVVEATSGATAAYNVYNIQRRHIVCSRRRLLLLLLVMEYAKRRSLHVRIKIRLMPRGLARPCTRPGRRACPLSVITRCKTETRHRRPYDPFEGWLERVLAVYNNVTTIYIIK